MEGESQPGHPQEYVKSSAWPLVVVLGLSLSEVGILFNLYPLSVGGLVLFVGGVSGIVDESGYVSSPWRLMGGLSIALVVLGALVVASQIDGGVAAFVEQIASPNGIVRRGYSIAGTGAILAVAAVVVPFVRNQ